MSRIDTPNRTLLCTNCTELHAGRTVRGRFGEYTPLMSERTKIGQRLLVDAENLR